MALGISIEPGPCSFPCFFFLPFLAHRAIATRRLFTPDLSRHPLTTLSPKEVVVRAARQIRLDRQQIRVRPVYIVDIGRPAPCNSREH